MSKISTVYDQLKDTTIPGLLPDHTRVPNPYSLTDNDEGLLCQGWGLKVNIANPFESEFKAFNVVRTFTVVLTREVIDLESQFDSLDTTSKLLLEDVVTLQKRLLNPDQITIEDDIEAIDIGNISAIEFVFGDKFNFAFMEADFLINIRENL